ncbi:hypothetical protein C9J22_20020 [Photobacterium phosphoreum]|uniref:DUF2971 domain-containing protein n=1 Tax=Photobacterium phosphoreum TaxID=659 RepID=UPI000D15AD49|nr:DUF2971 domain-containing protein [Photobacterium phosphoreum]PSU67299.1 hypothetical protein C9J22_20020 [Photobacterium phosphoreum]
MIKRIYKYMPLREAFFDNFLLRVSGRDALNDPFEFFPSELILSDSLSDMYTQEELDDFVFSKYGVISFTETRDNLLMWSHYGDNHKGFAVEFDYEHTFFHTTYSSESNDIEGSIHRVLYRKERFHELENEDGSAILELFFHKSDEWEYEKEHRLLASFKKTKSSKTLDIPNLKEEMFFCQVPENAILSITFGCKADCKVIERLKDTLSKNPSCKHIKLCKAVASGTDYKLEFNSH